MRYLIRKCAIWDKRRCFGATQGHPIQSAICKYSCLTFYGFISVQFSWPEWRMCLTIYETDLNVQGTAIISLSQLTCRIQFCSACVKVNGCARSRRVVMFFFFRFSLIFFGLWWLFVIGQKPVWANRSASKRQRKQCRKLNSNMNSVVGFVQSLHLLNLVCRVLLADSMALNALSSLSLSVFERANLLDRLSLKKTYLLPKISFEKQNA